MVKWEERYNRQRELEYLVALYKFYTENDEHLAYDNNYLKVIEAQEKKIISLLNQKEEN